MAQFAKATLGKLLDDKVEFRLYSIEHSTSDWQIAEVDHMVLIEQSKFLRQVDFKEASSDE